MMDKQAVEEVYNEDEMDKAATPLEPDHIKLADKIKSRAYLSKDQKEAIAFFLGDAFKDEDKRFDYVNWLKACGM